MAIPEERGNCFPTVMACIMGKDSPEDVIQIQEYYKETDEEEDSAWVDVLNAWLLKEGWEWYELEGHQYDDSYYFVVGKTERDTVHVCIFQNGELYHDPYPGGAGLTELYSFDYFNKIIIDGKPD